MRRGLHGVYSGFLERIHARIVALGVIHAVNTDDVDAELC